MKNKKIILSTIFILAFLIPISFFTIQNLSVIEMNETNSVETIDDVNSDQIIEINGRNYIVEYITEEKVEEIKEIISQTNQINQTTPSYTVIDNYCTGYTTPTEEELDERIGEVTIKEVISNTNGLKTSVPPKAKDLSTEKFFPVVGHQRDLKSCTAWANTYYAYGYMEAKDNDWDASSGNPDYLLSPAWSYNKLVVSNIGSNPFQNGKLLEAWGACTMSAMPYDDTDVDSWGNEAAWRQAPYHRPLDFTLITFDESNTVELIKSLIDTDIPVTFAIDAMGYKRGLDGKTGDYVISSEEYGLDRPLTHAQCIVGFDNDITEGSDVGAFKVVNSWGTNDGYTDKGYYWLTYDAFNSFGGHYYQELGFFTDRIDYQPSLIATWEFDSTPIRMDDIITLGIGSRGATITPPYALDLENVFPSYMTLDISEFDAYSDESFFLDIGSSNTFDEVVREYMKGSQGKLSAFRVERYGSNPTDILARAESPFAPKITPGYVECCFGELTHELKVTLDIPNKPIINSVNIVTATISNVGNNIETGIELYLSLNDIELEKITIDKLEPNEERSIEYDWAPIKYGFYNFTAHAPPISGETFIANNKMKAVAVVFLDSIIIDNKEPNNPSSFTWDEAVDNGICIKSGYIYVIIDTPIYGMYINNSNVPFVIMNCLIFDSIKLEAIVDIVLDSRSAIFLVNTTKGFLIDNRMTRSRHAIYLANSSHNSIYGNNIFRCKAGIYLEFNCYFNEIQQNTLTDCKYAMDIFFSSNNIIRGNKIDNEFYVYEGTGIKIIAGSSNLIVGNNISRCFFSGIHLGGYYSNDNNVTGNYVNNCGGGITLCDSDRNIILKNTVIQSGFFYYDHGGIQLLSSNNNEVLENHMINNPKYGLSVSGCSNNDIMGNKIIDSVLGGIQILESSFSTILKNEISDSDSHGIYLEGNSNENTMRENTIKDCERNGIYLDTDTFNNIAYLNILMGNGLNAVDLGANNRWNNWAIGNFWDDYDGIDANGDCIGDDPYSIPGTAGSVDNFPIPIITRPEDFSYKIDNTGNEISWTVTYPMSENHEYEVFINGAPHATGNWIFGEPIVIDVDKLEVGIYYFTIKIHDGYGGFISDEVMVEVKPMFPATPYIVVAMIVALVGVGFIINRKIKR